MREICLEHIPFQPDLAALASHLHIRAGSPHYNDLEALVRESQSLANPRAANRVGYVETVDSDHVSIDGIIFTSRVLRVNLDQVQRVFPYLATCGREMEDWAGTVNDPLLSFIADTLMQLALGAAIQALQNHVMELFQPGSLSSMNPGSLEDWPLTQQVPLFDLLAEPSRFTGVKLTESLLMSPIKSVSGIYFTSEDSFESCQLCQREACPNRRAPYDSELFSRRYQRLGSP